MNSAHFEGVFDPMAAALTAPLADLKREWMRLLAMSSFVGFNVVTSLVVYGIVLLMLLIMCFYVSRELLSVAASLDALNFKPRWPIEPAHAIVILILNRNGGDSALNAAFRLHGRREAS